MVAAILVLTVGLGGSPALAQPRSAEQVVSKYDYKTTMRRLARAIGQNEMVSLIISSPKGALKRIGVEIPGNNVLGVFAPRFAKRLLEAEPAAGIEAPLRVYVREAKDGKVTVSYFKPTAIFAPYKNEELDRMAHELDEILARIVKAVR
ncbi:MAG: DUF302 domain-containing protein [Myxococcota bacterium]